MTFDEYAPEAGQLLELDNRWHIVECHPLTRDITDEYHGGGPEIIDRQEYWSTGIREALEDGRKLTLLLPSPRQCKAAGLTAWEALQASDILMDDRELSNTGHHAIFYQDHEDRPDESSIKFDHCVYLNFFHLDGHVSVSGECSTVIDPETFETAANRMRALQAWLALWNEEAQQE